MNENTSIELYSKIQDPVQASLTLGAPWARGGLMAFKNIEQAQSAAWICLHRNWDLLDLQRRFHLTPDCKLVMKANYMLARFHEIGGEYVVLKYDKDGTSIRMKFRGNELTFGMTWEEAQGEKYPFTGNGKTLKSNWETDRGRMKMMFNRTVTDGIAVIAPEVISGEIDTEAEPAEVAPLLPTTQATIEPANVTPPTITVETKVETVTETPAEVKPEPVTQAPTTEPKASTFKAQPGREGGISGETRAAICEAIGPENVERAVKWLEAKGHIKPLQDLGDISVGLAQKILNTAPQFLKKVLEDTANA